MRLRRGRSEAVWLYRYGPLAAESARRLRLQAILSGGKGLSKAVVFMSWDGKWSGAEQRQEMLSIPDRGQTNACQASGQPGEEKPMG
jgi:hypothetical protein